MRKRLVVGNWKMNGGLAANAALLAALVRDWKSPPDRANRGVRPVSVPGQAQAALARHARWVGERRTSASTLPGAYTGEVSAGMLAEFGCRYVLVGAFRAAAALRRHR